MTIVYGFLGAILALGVFAAGVICGWRLNEKLREKRAVIAERQLGEEERERLRKEQEAFRTMLNYNVDQAYGFTPADYLSEDSETAVSDLE